MRQLASIVTDSSIAGPCACRRQHLPSRRHAVAPRLSPWNKHARTNESQINIVGCCCISPARSLARLQLLLLLLLLQLLLVHTSQDAPSSTRNIGVRRRRRRSRYTHSLQSATVDYL